MIIKGVDLESLDGTRVVAQACIECRNIYEFVDSRTAVHQTGQVL